MENARLGQQLIDKLRSEGTAMEKQKSEALGEAEQRCVIDDFPSTALLFNPRLSFECFVSFFLVSPTIPYCVIQKNCKGKPWRFGRLMRSK